MSLISGRTAVIASTARTGLAKSFRGEHACRAAALRLLPWHAEDPHTLPIRVP